MGNGAEMKKPNSILFLATAFAATSTFNISPIGASSIELIRDCDLPAGPIPVRTTALVPGQKRKSHTKERQLKRRKLKKQKR